MSLDWADFGPLLLAMPQLVALARQDLLQLKIPNKLVMAIIILFLASSFLFLPSQEILARVIAAVAVFWVGFAGFVFRLWGGGDVKALAALMLLLPSESFSNNKAGFSSSWNS